MLKRAVYKAWGPKPKLIKWIYTAIVRPRITYCAIAWSHTLRYTTRKITINKLNRLAATMITPVRRSTPIKALEILYDLIPLNLYCQYESLASLQRNQDVIKLNWRGESQKCKTYIGHRKHWINCMQEMGINILNTDNTKVTKWDKYYSVDLSSLNSCLLYTSPSPRD